jgi:ABC-type multidrug transport system fused ATPase/permease subunit
MLWKFAGRRVLLLGVLSLLTSNAEAFGIALFLPIISQGALGNDSLSVFLRRGMTFLHLPLSVPWLVLMTAALFLAKGLLQFGTGAYLYAISADVNAKIRRRLVDLLGRADYRYLLETNSGALTNTISNEVTRATSSFIYFMKLWPLAVNVCVFLVLVFFVNWKLMLLSVVVGGAVTLLLYVPGQLTEKYSARSTAESSALTQLLIQTVQAMKYLRATGEFSALEKRVDRSVEGLAHTVRGIGFLYALTVAIAQPVLIIFLCAILIYYYLHGYAMASLLVQVFYLNRIMTDVLGLQAAWQEVRSVAGGIQNVQGALFDLESHGEARGAVRFDGLKRGIDLRGVTVAFGDAEVLREATLTIPRHQTIAFVGESGAGKSTLVDLVSGVLKPSRGEVVYDDVSMTQLDIESLRPRIGYVPQDCLLFDDTIANNISLWDDGKDTRARVMEAARRASCDTFILQTESGYDTLIGERGVKLSGGQRQRLAIARELFREPEILILDEATSALDSESERAIQQSIDSLKGKMTILVIAHRLSTIRNVDRVFVLKGGRIVEEGGFDDLYAQPGSRFREMCEQQNLA